MIPKRRYCASMVVMVLAIVAAKQVSFDTLSLKSFTACFVFLCLIDAYQWLRRP